jgi:hypothetical protein
MPDRPALGVRVRAQGNRNLPGGVPKVACVRRFPTPGEPPRLTWGTKPPAPGPARGTWRGRHTSSGGVPRTVPAGTGQGQRVHRHKGCTSKGRLKACVPCEDRAVGPGPPRNRVAACRGRGSPAKRRWGKISVPRTGSKLLKQKSLEEPHTSWFPAKKADFGAPLGNQRVPEV